jgi:glycosyltransferase involved in cell wall biosynthesis
LVSVVVPFLNAEKFIEETIESVLAQTYRDWELLLLDDGSTDGSTDTALRYAEQLPGQVHYLDHVGHENRGISTSKNLAIANANDDYVAFLDSDDIWLPHTLERQVATLNSHPEAAMVYGSAEWWYGWTGSPEDIERDYVETHRVQPNALIHPPTLLVLMLRENDVPCSCTVLLRREALTRVGGFEDAFRGLYDDQALWAKIFLSMDVFVAGERWARYRQHPDSLCAVGKSTAQIRPAERDFLNWLGEYLSKQGVTSTAVWKAYRMAKWSHSHPALYRFHRVLRRANPRLES